MLGFSRETEAIGGMIKRELDEIEIKIEVQVQIQIEIQIEIQIYRDRGIYFLYE